MSNKVAVVTDSTACIPAELAKAYNNLHVAPQILIWGNETYRDGVDIQPDEFYQRLKTAKVMPSSSQISPAGFEKIFRDLLEQGYDVLAVLVSTKLSGTIDSANQAKAAIGSSAIEIVNSYTTAMALGFAAIAAAKAGAQGAGLEECKTVAELASSRTGVMITVDTLEYLHRGGRIGGAQRLLGTALNIKPILEVQNGRIEPVERVRTRGKAIARLIDLLDERTRSSKSMHLSVVHANVRSEAEELLAQVNGRFNLTEKLISSVSPVVGTHVGPGTIGFTWMTEE